MTVFQYGKTYVVKHTKTSITAFELMRRGNDYINVYIRKYSPGTSELISTIACLHVFLNEQGEYIVYGDDLYACESLYEGKICIYTREGLREYEETH